MKVSTCGLALATSMWKLRCTTLVNPERASDHKVNNAVSLLLHQHHQLLQPSHHPQHHQLVNTQAPFGAHQPTSESPPWRSNCWTITGCETNSKTSWGFWTTSNINRCVKPSCRTTVRQDPQFYPILDLPEESTMLPPFEHKQFPLHSEPQPLHWSTFPPPSSCPNWSFKNTEHLLDDCHGINMDDFIAQCPFGTQIWE